MRTIGIGDDDFSVHSAEMALLEIYWDSPGMDPPISPEDNDKLADAIEFAHAKEYQKAIDLLTEVNAKVPGRPSIIYNLATFRYLQDEEGRQEEYSEIIDMLFRDFPDYFFGQTTYATRLIAQDRLDEAWDILQPLYQIKHLHITEFKALSSAVIAYNLADGDNERAVQIHRAAVEVCGEDSFPSMESFETRLQINRLSRFIERIKSKKRGTKKTTTKSRKKG